MEWSGSTICISLNRRRGDHKPFDDDFQWHVGRMLRIDRGPRIKLWMSRWLSRAWGPGPLSWSATCWALRAWRSRPGCSRWSLRRVFTLRKFRGQSTVRRWNGRGLGGLRCRMARQWRVCMASSDPRHVKNRFFKWVAAGHLVEKNDGSLDVARWWRVSQWADGVCEMDSGSGRL